MKNRLSKYLFSTLVIVCCNFSNTSAFGQNKPVYFDRLNNSSGLSDNYTEHVTEDHLGFLWVSTRNGLNRYDGNSFKIYRYSQADSNSLPNDMIYCVYEDKKGRLWVGTSGGLALYNRRKDNFTRVNLFDERTPQKNIKITWGAREDSHGNLWFCTVGGIVLLDEKTKTFSWDLSRKFELQKHVVLDFIIDHADNKWIATERGGVFRIDAQARNSTQYTSSSKPMNIAGNNIKCIIEDRYNRIWAGSTDSGISIIDPQKHTVSNLGTKNGLITPLITSLYESKSGVIWTSCINGGLMYFNSVENKFILFNIKSSDKNEVGLKSITSVFEDSNGIFWITGRASGLLSLNPHKNRFVAYRCSDNGTGLNNPVVTSFHEDRYGRIWIGTDGGGVNIFNPANNSFEYIDTRRGLSCDAVLDIEKFDEQNLWVSTWGGGLNQVNIETKAVKRIFNDEHAPGKLVATKIKCLLNDDTLIWIGTQGEGIQAYDRKRKTIINDKNNTKIPFQLIDAKWCNSIMKDSKGRIWFSSSYGLFVLDGRTFTTYLHDSTKTSVNGFSITQTYEDLHQRIWIISEGGLNLYNEATNNFTNINSLVTGIPYKLNAIIGDYNDNLWIGTNMGLIKYKHESKFLKIYSESEGLQGNEFFENACMRSNRGELYFGGVNGFNRSNPQATRAVRKLPKVYITDIDYYNTRAKSDNDLFISKSTSSHDTVYLRYNQSIFSIRFTGLYLLSPQDVIYKYKLDGFNQNWITTQERKATYTNLDPGTYTFFVNALTRDGAWAVEADSVTLVILPPWWKTLAFRILFVLSITIIILSIFFVRIRSMQKENSTLEQRVKDRTRELDMKNQEIMLQGERIREQLEILEFQNKELVDLNYTKDKFLSIIGHDLKNPMNTVIGFSELLITNVDKFHIDKVRSYLKLIHDSSRNIHELLKNLLDWSRSQTGHISYNPSEMKLGKMMEEIRFFMEEMAKNKDIALNLELPGENISVMADKNMVEAILRNLVNNSIKFTKTQGSITMKVEAQDDNIIVSVSDTGVGMNQEKIAKLFMLGVKSNTKGTNNEPGTGLGLLICQEFLKYHNSKMHVESQEGHGTRFWFVLHKS